MQEGHKMIDVHFAFPLPSINLVQSGISGADRTQHYEEII